MWIWAFTLWDLLYQDTVSILLFTWMTWKAQQIQWSSWCCQRSWGSGNLWSNLFPDRATTCCSRPCNRQRGGNISKPDKKKDVSGVKDTPLVSIHSTYPGCDLAVPERIGEDWGRDWLDPAMLEEEEEEEEEANNPGLLVDERENGPGKLSSMETKTTL